MYDFKLIFNRIMKNQTTALPQCLDVEGNFLKIIICSSQLDPWTIDSDMDPKSFSLEKDNEFPLHLYGTECVPPPPASIPPSSIPTSPPLHLSTLPDSLRPQFPS